MLNFGSRALALFLALFVLVPGAALAGTTVSGEDPEDIGEPLTISPDMSAAPDRVVSDQPAGAVAFIQRMPVDKRVNSVALGPFSIPETCAATIYAHLRVYEHPYRMLRKPPYSDVPEPQEVGRGAFPVLFNRNQFAIGRWPTEEPIEFKAGRAYSFDINLSGPTTAPPEGQSVWPSSCYSNTLRRQMWSHYRHPDADFTVVNAADLPCESTDGPVSLPTVRFYAWPNSDPAWHTSGEDAQVANDLCLTAAEHAGQYPDPQNVGYWMQAHTYVSDSAYHPTFDSRGHMADTAAKVAASISQSLCDSGPYAMEEHSTGQSIYQIDPNWFSPPGEMWSGVRMARCYQTTYAPPGAQVPHGWYYGLPLDQYSYVPFDIYVSLDPAHVAPGSTDPRELFGDANPANPDAARCDNLDPVNCATGNFHQSFTDLALPGRGIGVSAERTYNAQAAALGDVGSFGRGWSSDIDASVIPAGDEGAMTVRHGNGASAPFSAGSTPDAFAGGAEWVRSRLERVDGGALRYELPNRTKVWFDDAGRAIKTSDRGGRQTLLTRNSAGKVTTLSAGGRELTYTYNSGGFVASVSDGTGRSVTYDYDGDKLVSVTDPAGKTTTFTYDGDGRMTSFETPRGALVQNSYDSLSRVTQQTDPLGNASTLEYSRSTTGTRTKLTDRQGNVTIKRFARGLPISITRAHGTPHATTVRMDYDHRAQLRILTDEAGNQTRYRYDANGQTTAVTDAEGRRTTFVWDEGLLSR